MIVQVYASRHPDRLGGLVLADTFTPAFVSRRDHIERTALLRTVIGLVRLVGYDRAKALVLWFGRKLEGDKTTSLRVEAFPNMDTTSMLTHYMPLDPFTRQMSISPRSPSRR